MRNSLKILDVLEDVNWTIGDSLWHLSCRKKMRNVTQSSEGASTRWCYANLFVVKHSTLSPISYPVGWKIQPSSNSNEVMAMFSTTEDYLNLKAAVSAITTCILELVTEKLGQEIYKVTEKSEGLHTIGDHPLSSARALDAIFRRSLKNHLSNCWK